MLVAALSDLVCDVHTGKDCRIETTFGNLATELPVGASVALVEMLGPRLMFRRVPDFSRERQRSMNRPQISKIVAIHQVSQRTAVR